MILKDKQNASNNKGVTVLIPQGIDVYSLPNNHSRNPMRGVDKAVYFLSQFVTKNTRKKLPINTPIPVTSKWLKSVFGSDYHLVLRGFIKTGIIVPVLETYTYHNSGVKEQHVRAYSVTNGQCKRYRLNVPADTLLRQYRILDPGFIQKIKEARIKSRKELTSKNPTAKNVYAGLTQLSIHTSAAKAYVKHEYKYGELLGTVRWLFSSLSKREIRAILSGVCSTREKRAKERIIRDFGIRETERVLEAITNHQKLLIRMHYIDILDQIQRGAYDLIWMTEDKKTGRLFHTGTASPKDLRRFMRLDGQKLVEIDASNCQWHLFLGFLRDFLSFHNQSHKDTHQPHHKPLLYLFPENSKLKLEREIETLENELINKQFRERMAQKLGVDLKKAKKELISNVLFGNPGRGDYNNWRSVTAFREDYPALFDVITKLKTEWLNETQFGYDPQERFKALPVLMQKMEAEIFIKGIEECPGAFLTLHDAIITTDQNLGVVRHHLEKSIRDSGIKLKLNEKEY